MVKNYTRKVIIEGKKLLYDYCSKRKSLESAQKTFKPEKYDYVGKGFEIEVDGKRMVLSENRYFFKLIKDA